MKGKFWRNMILMVIAITLVLGTTMTMAKEPYKIGVSVALTGPLAFLGKPELRGAELAVEMINAKGGIHGRKIELIIEDDQAKPELCVAKANKLISQDNVLSIFGGSNGDACMAIAAIAERKKVPFISPTGFSGTEVQRNYRYNFCLIPDYEDAVEMLINYSIKKYDCKRIGLLRLTRLWGVQASKAFHKLKDKYGITIVREETCHDRDKDFTPQLANIKAADPCAICIWASTPALAIAIKNTRQLGIKVPIMSNVVLASKTTPKIAGEAAEGAIGAATMIWTDPLPRQKEYVKKFLATYNTPPDMWDAMGYDGMSLFAKAIESLPPDKVNRQNINDQLESIKRFEGANAVIDYTKQHWPIAESWVLMTIKDGKFKRLFVD